MADRPAQVQEPTARFVRRLVIAAEINGAKAELMIDPEPAFSADDRERIAEFMRWVFQRLEEDKTDG